MKISTWHIAIIATYMGIVPFFADAGNAPVITFFAEPGTVEKGESTTLTWFAESAVECMLLNASRPPSGFAVVHPSNTRDYTISCRGDGGASNKTLTVTVTETPSGSNGNSSTNGSTPSNSEHTILNAGCVANPTIVPVNTQVIFTGTAAGGEGALRYQWSGDVTGNGSRIITLFGSAGTKTATLSVTDSRGITVTSSCNVFVEPTNTIVTPTVQQNTPPAPPHTPSTQDNESSEDETNELVAATAQSGGGLVTVFIISIIIAMAGLLYFFIYAKRKKEKEAEALREKEVFAEQPS